MPLPETLQLCQELLRQYEEAEVKPSRKTTLLTIDDFTLRVGLYPDVNRNIPNSAWIEIFCKNYLILRTLDFVSFDFKCYKLGSFNVEWDDRFHIITIEDFLCWLGNLDIDWDEVCRFNMKLSDVAKLKRGNVQLLPRAKNARK